MAKKQRADDKMAEAQKIVAKQKTDESAVGDDDVSPEGAFQFGELKRNTKPWTAAERQAATTHPSAATPPPLPRRRYPTAATPPPPPLCRLSSCSSTLMVLRRWMRSTSPIRSWSFYGKGGRMSTSRTRLPTTTRRTMGPSRAPPIGPRWIAPTNACRRSVTPFAQVSSRCGLVARSSWPSQSLCAWL